MQLKNIKIIGTPEEEEKEQGIETLFKKIMTENFQNLRGENPFKLRKHRGSQST